MTLTKAKRREPEKTSQPLRMKMPYPQILKPLSLKEKRKKVTTAQIAEAPAAVSAAIPSLIAGIPTEQAGPRKEIASATVF